MCPEFFNAYMARNVGFAGVGFPTPKFKEKDLTANPEKYAQQKKEYLEARSRKFITMRIRIASREWKPI